MCMYLVSGLTQNSVLCGSIKAGFSYNEVRVGVFFRSAKGNDLMKVKLTASEDKF